MLISNELIWLKKTLTLRLFFTWFNALVNTPSEVQQSKLFSTQNSVCLFYLKNIVTFCNMEIFCKCLLQIEFLRTQLSLPRNLFPMKISKTEIHLQTIIISSCRGNRLSSRPAITCSKLTIETIEQGVKYVQS